MWELTIHIAIIINLAHCILTICKYAGVVPLEEEESTSNSAGCVKSVSVHSQSSQELPDLPPVERAQSELSQDSQVERSQCDPDDPVAATDVDSAWSHADTLLLIETYRQFRGQRDGCVQQTVRTP